ncbi:MAG: DUF6588 family protein, partial [Bacteroidota bacterium]
MFKKKIALTLIIMALASLPVKAQERADDFTIELARMFSSDLFELNGVPYLQPMVKAINATSNSRFFNQAYVPAKVNKPYFRVGVHAMLGFTPEEDKTYKPVMPSEEFDPDDLTRFGSIGIDGISVNDTAGLVRYFFLNLMQMGVYGDYEGTIPLPEQAATVLGDYPAQFIIPDGALDTLAQKHPLYQFLPDDIRDSVSSILSQFPSVFDLAPGADISTIFVGIPQIEVGSFMGTEALIRFIPPIYMGKNIGDFAFWGIGLKHSISQYFNKRHFDLAVQGVYQGTHLENTIGVTNAELTADATIFNFNIQASKEFENILDVYTGFSYDMITINSSYVYTLPVTVQWDLGLLERG